MRGRRGRLQGVQRHAYGPHPDQYGELWLPEGARLPGTVVVIHGGFWRARYDASLGRPLARDLAARGWVTWNIEYRRVARGGGWPGTLEDVSAAIDLLATLGVDQSRTVAIGHSAGGHLAAWAASRPNLADGTPGADPAVRLSGVVTQAGVLDLVTAAQTGVGGRAVPDLLGGMPGEVPQRYAVADPLTLAPAPAAVVCLHSRRDEAVPFAQSEAYVAAAHRAGARARLVETKGDHMALVDPGSPEWATVVELLPELLGGETTGLRNPASGDEANRG
jgi:acetyl esterase/lipase